MSTPEIPASDFSSLAKGIGFISKIPTTTIAIYENDVPIFTRIKAHMMKDSIKLVNPDVTRSLLTAWIKQNGEPN